MQDALSPRCNGAILGFGSAVRVVAPERLVSDIYTELDAARAGYARRSQFPMLRMAMSGERGTMTA